MWNLCWDFLKPEPSDKLNDQKQSTAHYKEIITRYPYMCLLPVHNQYYNHSQKRVRLAIQLTSGINPWKVVDRPMSNDYCQISLCLSRFTVFQMHEVIPIAVSRGNKIVSIRWANLAKVNNNQRIGRIKIKKEREKRIKT